MSGPGSYFSRIDYEALNAKQKEVHNFHVIAAALARCGFASYPIRDDWNGGDLIARHMTDFSIATITVQIKGRVTFDKKYQGKSLWIGFPYHGAIYVYPHDEILAAYLKARNAKGQPLEKSKAWSEDGCVHWAKPTEELLKLLDPYRLADKVASTDRFAWKSADLEIVLRE